MEEHLLHRIQRGDTGALEEAIGQYGGYVYTVVQSWSRDSLPREDMEELTADVFVTLWQKAVQSTPGHLRGWLGTVARNKTVDRLRKRGVTVPLEEEYFTAPDDLWNRLQMQERQRLVREALNVMEVQDREIFIRYYDWDQPMKAIAAEMELGESAVKMRLHRGRKQLKQYLTERGIAIEDYV